MEKKKYIQSQFDQAFVNAVSYLYKAGKLQQKVFANELDMPASNFNDILAGGRGVPKTKIEFAKYLLREKYNVVSDYLETGVGAILKNPLELDLNNPQVIELVKENETLKLKISDLEKHNADLKKLNENQEFLIASLRALIESRK